MAYFGDAVAQSSMLGIALSLTFSISIFFGVLSICLTTALIISFYKASGYAVDTLLGVIAHSALAFGLVIASFLSGVRIDLMAYLFGDILSVTRVDLLVIWIGSFLVVLSIYWRWTSLLTSTLNEDLASVCDINPKFEQTILNLTLAIVVGVSIKIVGVLLIISLLIIPPASIRFFSKTPEQMLFLSGCVGCVSVLVGINFSYNFDTPTGPTIVCVAAAFFIISSILSLIIKKSSIIKY